MKDILLYITFIFILSSCQSKKNEHSEMGDVYYTCSMHPQVVLNKMGTCPICHMNLVMVKRQVSTNPSEISLSDEQIMLGNIKTDTIENSTIGDNLLLNGVLNFNQNERSTVSTRIMGRIDKLYFKNIGDYVDQGTPLYSIYSEELNNAKQEYITALNKKRNIDKNPVDVDEVANSAAHKLQLWGLSINQIKELEQTQKIDINTTIFSPYAGYITSISITEGGYVEEGTSIFNIANLSTLWVDAQVFASQLSLIHKDSKSTILIPDLNNLEVDAKVEFINPEINDNSRINIIRFTIPNYDQKLRPGMPVYVKLKKSLVHSLTLPTDAVLRDGKGATVWKQTGSNKYSSIMVQTGIESDGKIEIKSGINEKDIIVTSGTYLLNSEFIFKNGANPMAGMKM